MALDAAERPRTAAGLGQALVDASLTLATGEAGPTVAAEPADEVVAGAAIPAGQRATFVQVRLTAGTDRARGTLTPVVPHQTRRHTSLLLFFV